MGYNIHAQSIKVKSKSYNFSMFSKVYFFPSNFQHNKAYLYFFYKILPYIFRKEVNQNIFLFVHNHCLWFFLNSKSDQSNSMLHRIKDKFYFPNRNFCILEGFLHIILWHRLIYKVECKIHKLSQSILSICQVDSLRLMFW